MVVEFITFSVFLIACFAEWQHRRRIRRVAFVAFGPAGRPLRWTVLAPGLRILGIAAACWGLLSLLLVVEPRVHNSQQVEPGKEKHLVLIIDVSPSMGLADAGTEKKDSRRQRAVAVLQSLFERVPIQEYLVSIIAVYSDAKPILEDSRDFEVARHILSDLPMWHAFQPGRTQLFSGIQAAANLAKHWNPRSTTVILLTDGDTVPASGMPTMPDSVANVIVIGVGDANSGMFIDGHQSRQDMATLRQVAYRLQGIYHDGNQQHITSAMIEAMNAAYRTDQSQRWGRREWSMLALLGGSSILAILPLLLNAFGSRYRPGVNERSSGFSLG